MVDTGRCVDKVKKLVDFSWGLKCLLFTEVECSLCKSGKMTQIENLWSFWWIELRFKFVKCHFIFKNILRISYMHIMYFDLFTMTPPRSTPPYLYHLPPSCPFIFSLSHRVQFVLLMFSRMWGCPSEHGQPIRYHIPKESQLSSLAAINCSLLLWSGGSWVPRPSMLECRPVWSRAGSHS